jgi:hypothetical protein
MSIRFSGRGRIMAIGLAGLLALGIVGAGSVAMAEGPGPGSGSPAAQPGGQNRPKILRATVHDIIKTSGIPAATFKQGAKDGKSLSQVISQNGGKPADVQAAVLSDLTAKVNEAVTNGKLTKDRADKILAKAPDALTKLMNAVPRPKDGDQGKHRPRPVVKNVLQTAAQTIGIDVKDLAKELRDGKSIADVAGAHGSSGDAVIGALVGKANAAIDKAVTNGKIKAENAPTAKAKAAAVITKLVNEPRPHPLKAQGQ